MPQKSAHVCPTTLFSPLNPMPAHEKRDQHSGIIPLSSGNLQAEKFPGILKTKDDFRFTEAGVE